MNFTAALGKEMAMKIRVLFFAVLMALAVAASFTSAPFSFADGSDPMPLCRGKNCK
jgi:hypothetical protein